MLSLNKSGWPINFDENLIPINKLKQITNGDENFVNTTGLHNLHLLKTSKSILCLENRYFENEKYRQNPFYWFEILKFGINELDNTLQILRFKSIE